MTVSRASARSAAPASAQRQVQVAAGRSRRRRQSRRKVMKPLVGHRPGRRSRFESGAGPPRLAEPSGGKAAIILSASRSGRPTGRWSEEHRGRAHRLRRGGARDNKWPRSRSTNRGANQLPVPNGRAPASGACSGQRTRRSVGATTPPEATGELAEQQPVIGSGGTPSTRQGFHVGPTISPFHHEKGVSHADHRPMGGIVSPGNNGRTSDERHASRRDRLRTQRS